MPTPELTTSQRRLVALAAALATEPQVLLVDELAAGAGAGGARRGRGRDRPNPRARRRGAGRRAQPAPRAPRRRPRARARRRHRASPRARSPRSPRAGSCSRRTSERARCRLSAVRRTRVPARRSRAARGGLRQGIVEQTRPARLVIAVDVPVTGSPYVAQTIRQGVELATSNLNGGGGVRVGYEELPAQGQALRQPPLRAHAPSRTRGARSTRARSRSSPTAPAWTRPGSWRSEHGVSIAITYDGGTGLVDAETRPNVFRIAPTNHGIAFRYAEYLIPKKLKVALLSDDSALRAARARPTSGRPSRRTRSRSRSS